MNVTIRCESLLERDAARYFEFAPRVKLFFHNAEEFEYYDQDGLPRRYYPDFVVELVDDHQERIEVKPKDVLLDPVKADRYALIAIRYVSLGQSFKMLTDEFLHAEPLNSTLKLLAGHRGQKRLMLDLVRLVQAVPRRIEMSVADAIQYLGSERLVYQAIANGFLYFDIERPLNLTARVQRLGDAQ
jgi:hypothetical protein